MHDYVVFTLVAPMGAFGELAGHERRGSLRWPGRSALLGLMGAASGVRRCDQIGQEALAQWKIAVSVLSAGNAWRDFHTVQTVPTSRAKRPVTRRDAILALTNKDKVLITQRDYHSDCAFGVALWGGDVASMVKSLTCPVFVPYLGRKSCPLSAPMAPKVVRSDDIRKALAQIHLPGFLSLDPSNPELIASDEEIQVGVKERIEPDFVETRWDVPLDRNAWHFTFRSVFVYQRTGES